MSPTTSGDGTFRVFEGASYTLTVDDLAATDIDMGDGPAELTWTVTTAPTRGQLELSGNPGTAISSFTQAQLEAGEVVYVHDDSNTPSDGFTLQVADDQGIQAADPVIVSIDVTRKLDSIDLSEISVADGFIIQGDMSGDQAGFSVSGAGDVNGDGFADLIVGARFGNDGGSNAGEAYVVFGKASGFGTSDNTNRQVVDLASLAREDGFIIQGDAADDRAGYSVSSAGDVNGDGFADLIVGARFGDDGGTDAGEAYVVFGKASGPSDPFGSLDPDTNRRVVDLTNLDAGDGFIIQGDVGGDQAGFSVSGTGDVNGDGYADLIVGARLGNDGGTYAGEAYVVFGKQDDFGDDVSNTLEGGTPVVRRVVDLTDLAPEDGFIIQGDKAGDQAGRSVSGAGDVNGDGYADLIVGAPFGDDDASLSGEAYVVFGKASGFGSRDGTRRVVDLTNLGEAEGFIIQGDAGYDRAGWSVSGAGDVNGDGFADLIVGAPRGDDGGNNAGEAYVVFGKEDHFGSPDGDGCRVIDLTSLDARDGFIIQGDADFDNAGVSVSGAGDVNGDGFADLIVGAPRGDDGGNNAGEAYVVFGKASGFGDDVSITLDSVTVVRQVIDLTNLGTGDGFIIQGDAQRDGAGRSVSGDVNGDGYDDLIVGALKGDDGGNNAGEAYVLFGGPAGLSTEAAAVLGTDGDDVLNADGEATVVLAGTGDDVLTIDGFGDTDLLKFDGGSGTDILRLVNPSAGTGLSLDLSTLADTRLSSIERIDLSGGDPGGNNSLRLTRRDLLNLSEVRTKGAQGADGSRAELWVDGNTGDSVVIVGDWMEGDTQEIDNTMYQTFDSGNARLLVNTAVDVNVSPTTSGDGTFRVFEGASYTLTVDDLAATDIDMGDGPAELTWTVATVPTRGQLELSGNPGTDISSFTQQQLEAGEVVYVHDDSDTLSDGFTLQVADDEGIQAADPVIVNIDVTRKLDSIDLSELSVADGFIIQGDAVDDRAGISVSGAGDVNGDGFADLIVGASGGDDGDTNAGEAYIVFGKASGPSDPFGSSDGSNRQVVDLTSLAREDGFIIQGDAADDRAGFSVSGAGDVNGDGYADLIFGAHGGDDGGGNAGEAYVVFGKASSLGSPDSTNPRVVDLTSLAPADGFIIQGDVGNDRAGQSVSGAGDVNGDGYADLIVGALYGDDGGTDAGEAYVVFGKASSLGSPDNTNPRVVDLTNLGEADGFIIQGDEAGDLTGRSVSGVGDVNGDGYADLIVGAPRGDDGGRNAGEAYVVFGKEDDFGSPDGYDRWMIDLTSLAAGDGFILQGDTDGDNAGFRVSSAGDVDGDGYADLIVGAVRGNDGGTDAGEAYVVFGKASGFGSDMGGRQVIDLTELDAASGFIIQGDAAGDTAGRSVSGAGDVNGDGFADLIVGARNGDDGGTDAGEAYVVFGKASGFGSDMSGRQVIDLTELDAASGFIIQGDVSGDWAGRSVSGAGDVNGDGYADLIVGARDGDDGGSNAGEAYVLFGGPVGLSTEAAAVLGTDGADVLNADGEATVVLAGAGDDVLTIDGFGDTDLLRFDGGSGTDTLSLVNPDADTGLRLDLSTLADTRLSSIERIDLSGSSGADNSLTLTRQDLLNLSEVRTEGRAELRVDGNTGDSVAAADDGWVQGGNQVREGNNYNVFDNGNVRLLVNTEVSLGGNLMATSRATMAEVLQHYAVAQMVDIRAFIDDLPPEDEEQQRKRLEDELAMLGPLPEAKAAMELAEPAAVAEPDLDLFDLPPLIPDDG